MLNLPANARIGVITRLFATGDSLFLLPFVMELRRRFPQAHITWITTLATECAFAKSLKPLVQGYLDDIISEVGFFCQPHGWPADKNRHFDLLFSVYAKRRTNSRIIRFMRPTHFIAMDYYYGFFIRLKHALTTGNLMEIQHHRDRMMYLLDCICPLRPEDCPKDGPKDGPLLTPDLAPWRPLAEKLLPPGPRYMGFAPGAGGPEKRWPPERFISMAQLAQTRGLTPVFIMGPEEQAMIPAVRKALPDALLPESDIPPAEAHLRSPMLVSTLAERMELTLCNDSGNAHMLALGHTPLIILYKYHEYSVCFWPQGDRDIAINACDFDLKSPKKPDMNAIPEQVVADAIETLLQRIESCKKTG